MGSLEEWDLLLVKKAFQSYNHLPSFLAWGLAVVPMGTGKENSWIPIYLSNQGDPTESSPGKIALKTKKVLSIDEAYPYQYSSSSVVPFPMAKSYKQVCMVLLHWHPYPYQRFDTFLALVARMGGFLFSLWHSLKLNFLHTLIILHLFFKNSLHVSHVILIILHCI